MEEVEAIHNSDTAAVLTWIDTTPRVSEVERTLKEIIASFEIVDWSLFDGEEEE
jgi:hypothetical protein